MRDRWLQFWKVTEKHAKLQKIAKLKAALYKIGIKDQISLYGICKIETEKGEKYRRIEVFSDKQFMPQDITQIYQFFSNYVLDKTDSIFIYHNKELKELTIND